MAVSNKAVFELRPASGSDLNSGGFIPGGSGTDRSQSGSPFVTFDGVTILAVTAGTSATITITGYTVVAGDVDNLLRIASGTNFTPGLYQIVSVNTGANTWTLDRNCSSGVGAAMVGRMGGALATIVQFFTDTNANAVPGGYTCYVTGTITVTTAIAITNNYGSNAAGSNTAVTCAGVQIIGYTSSRGDNGQATVTTATNSIDLFHLSNGAGTITFFNFNFTTSAGTVADGFNIPGSDNGAGRVCFDNCLFNGLKEGILCSDGQSANDTTIVQCVMRNCEVKSCTTMGLQLSGMAFLSGCYIHDNTSDGLRFNHSSLNVRGLLVLNHCIFYNNTGAGVQNLENGSNVLTGTNGNYFTNCAFVSNGGDGVKFTTSGSNGTPLVYLQNNIFYGNTGIGVNCVVLYGVGMGSTNAFGSNTGGNRSTSWVTLPGDISLSADPFTAKGSGDFSLNSTAGGGAACKQVGFPGVLQHGGTGFADIGPLSPQASAGASVIAVECNTSIIINRGGVAGY